MMFELQGDSCPAMNRICVRVCCVRACMELQIILQIHRIDKWLESVFEPFPITRYAEEALQKIL